MNWNEAYKRENKLTWEDVADSIHELVPVGEALRRYCPGIEIRHNRCPCPIHHGKDHNFSFTEKGYKCFVCGASGDVIALVKDICECATRADAMKQINEDFNLHLSIGGTISHELSEAMRSRRELSEQRQKALEEWQAGYEKLMDEWCRLDRQKRDCAVGSGAWIEAVQNIDAVAYAIDSYPPKPRW